MTVPDQESEPLQQLSVTVRWGDVLTAVTEGLMQANVDIIPREHTDTEFPASFSDGDLAKYELAAALAKSLLSHGEKTKEQSPN